MSETMLVRLKPYDPRRRCVLRQFTYRGIKFQASKPGAGGASRGWYRVEPDVAAYLRDVRQVAADAHSPLAFDVCTEAEARELEAREQQAAEKHKAATDEIALSAARSGEGMPQSDGPTPREGRGGKRGKNRG